MTLVDEVVVGDDGNADDDDRLDAIFHEQYIAGVNPINSNIAVVDGVILGNG